MSFNRNRVGNKEMTYRRVLLKHGTYFFERMQCVSVAGAEIQLEFRKRAEERLQIGCHSTGPAVGMHGAIVCMSCGQRSRNCTKQQINNALY